MALRVTAILHTMKEIL